MARTYVILLRGINVGGKNKVPMAQLRECLEELGLTEVRTYIASGNAIARSTLGVKALTELIEAELPRRFQLDTHLLRVLVLPESKLRAIVADKPAGFGEQPGTYHCDAIFLIDIPVATALEVFDPREGVDEIWPGKGVIYSQRLSAERTKSRLGKIVGTETYQSMTIRNWRTATKLVELLDA